jgi:hypothetical protein
MKVRQISSFFLPLPSTFLYPAVHHPGSCPSPWFSLPFLCSYPVRSRDYVSRFQIPRFQNPLPPCLSALLKVIGGVTLRKFLN